MHKVWVSVRSGWPVREYESMVVAGGASVAASVEFSFDAAAEGSDDERGLGVLGGGWFVGHEDVEASIFEVHLAVGQGEGLQLLV